MLTSFRVENGLGGVRLGETGESPPGKLLYQSGERGHSEIVSLEMIRVSGVEEKWMDLVKF